MLFIDWVEQVDEVRGEDVVCVIKNTATLTGSLFTLHASQVHIDLPTLSDKDKEVSPALKHSKFLIWLYNLSCRGKV